MSEQGLRFVILEHDHPFLHWDLMLEADEWLDSWRLLQPVRLSEWIPAESIAPHRKLYLNYEGPVSNHRGTVSIFTSGTFTECEIPGALADGKLSRDPTIHFTAFSLWDCSMATLAVCRKSSGQEAAWWFA